VVPDRTKDRRESFRALEIKILPPGTLTLEEETHKQLRGTVERAPTLPQRQNFGGGREGVPPLLFQGRHASLFSCGFVCLDVRSCLDVLERGGGGEGGVRKRTRSASTHMT